MAHIKTIRHRIEGTDCMFAQAELYYDLGGPNVWYGTDEPRGYWISVRKVKRQSGFVSYELHDGTRYFLKEVKRRTKKADAEVETYFNENYMRLINRTYPDVTLSSGCTIE